jgi:DNA-binding PadR family transcriptional regulator
MAINNEKVDEMTLALLYLTTFKDKYGLRAWKSHDWDVLNRLHENGYIHDPATKAKSVRLTEEGAERSRRLFEKHFMTE